MVPWRTFPFHKKVLYSEKRLRLLKQSSLRKNVFLRTDHWNGSSMASLWKALILRVYVRMNQDGRWRKSAVTVKYFPVYLTSKPASTRTRSSSVGVDVQNRVQTITAMRSAGLFHLTNLHLDWVTAIQTVSY